MQGNGDRTSRYKASTNGAVERLHRTLNAMLGRVVSVSQRDWDERVPMVWLHTGPVGMPLAIRQVFGREVRAPLTY